ncbi:tyrosine-type recombinase/integrase [bacterium]|nr:tyrosine-type recombinase/integrase [bacterium]
MNRGTTTTIRREYRTMPRQKSQIPAYLFHKPSGQARVRISGKDFYLGPFGSEDSRRKYGELVAKFASGRMIDPIARVSPNVVGNVVDPGPSIAELWLAFLDHAERHYVKNGKPTAEVDCFKSAMSPVVSLYGLLPCRDFGPLQLVAARNAMVAKGWTRIFVNKSVGRVRAVFRWGVANELADIKTLQRLETVAALRRGKTEAKDRPKRQAVPVEHVDAVKAIVSPLVSDLMSLQLLTAARPGELIMLTSGMIDRSGSIWVANLVDHKTMHHEQERKLFFGPRSQALLLKYLKASPDARLFQISRKHYSNCIASASEKLELPRFTAHWLRHNVTTEVRDSFGIEAAQAMAGHARPDMTANYSRKMDKLAAEVAAKIG